DYVTNTLGRDVILVVKTGSPMTIDATVHNNPHVTAILEIGHSGQEEGSALVAALFDDGYEVQSTASGYSPAASKYSPYATYTEYPGYLPTGQTTIPAFSPAGRLSATWYRQVEDMVGASEDNPPASYRWPAYSETGNDNLSNMNGTVPKGLMTYDIVKGERTYQYFNGTPLYEFGYGLTYTDFDHTATVSPLANGTVTVSGTVRNTGSVTSDEVVEVYATYAGTPSRIDQANKRLIAFDRLKNIAPNTATPFSFEIDALDKLGVWDVERSAFIIEPGTYTISVGPSSSTVEASGTLTVTEANGGTPAGTRNLTVLTQAENFDDYSNYSLDGSDIEIVSTSDALYSPESVWMRQAGTWLNYQDVAVAAGTDTVTVRVGADRTGNLQVYALPPGSPASDLATATPAATIPLTDTRPVSGIPAGLGIGPIAVRNSPFANHQYPGSPQGQDGTDANGVAYKNAYITPEYENRSVAATIPTGTWDIYLVSTSRGTRVEWLELGSDPQATASLAISQLYSADSIRSKGGTLDLDATPTPASSVSPIVWSVTASDGGPTALASIDQTGVLTASGTGNGTVLVTATSNGHTATLEVLVTNQLDANKVAIGAVAKTVEYPIMRTGMAFGQTDTITHYRGTSAQSVVFSELFAENADSFYLPGALLTVPAWELNWSIADPAGGATALAGVDHLGVVTATGAGDGDVVVTATLKANPDISTSRTLRLTNQQGRNPYRMVQMENYDSYAPPLTGTGFTPPAPTLSTWGSGANETGTAARTEATGTTHTFSRVDFRDVAASQFAIRLATDTGAAEPFTVEVWANAPSAGAGGTLLASVADTTDTSNGLFHTYTAPVASPPAGVHDIYIASTGALRINWWTFATSGRIDDEASALIDATDGLPVGGNSAAAWTAFTDARSALVAAAGSSATTQRELDRAEDALVKAFGAIEVPAPANLAPLQAAISAAEALRSGDYTTTSWASVNAALTQARAVVASPYPLQSEADSARTALISAIAALTVPDPGPQPVDPAAELAAAKAVLAQLIRASAGFADGAESYTAATWAVYSAALAVAQGAATNTAATLAAVRGATTTLADAMNGLVRSPAKDPNGNDPGGDDPGGRDPAGPDPAVELASAKASLDQLIRSGGALTSTQGLFTAATWSAYATALAEAQRVAGASGTTSAQARDASAALAAAMAGLVRAPVSDAVAPRVDPAAAPLTALGVSQTSVRIAKGTKVRPLTVAYTAGGAAQAAVTWTSSKPSVVKVNKATGRILGLKAGTATVTGTALATPGGPTVKATVKVTVVTSKTKVKRVSATVPATLAPGATHAVAARVTPAKATGAEVRYYTTNPAVLSVDEAGLLTAHMAGKSKVMVKAGGKTAVYTVAVVR
ncbi:MAG: fibronectin type III-like domain-contianing protein, partial [Bifidobacteriaceae bacterium]|nr:fibronectin type III-like domain-contianing protein [Bifidobacteriaceae bacterium]